MARYLGIEIAEHKVRAVSVRTAFRVVEIEAVIAQPRERRPDGLADALAQVLASIPRPIDGVFVAMPGTDVSLRVIEVPRVLARRGARMLATELEGSLPFEVDDAVLDAQPVREGDPTELLVAAARRERVRMVMDAMRTAGAEPRELGIAPASLGELFKHIPELTAGSPTLVVHAHEGRADIAIVAGAVVHTARTLTGQQNPNARVREIRQTLGAYMAGGGLQPASVLVCGETSYLYPPELIAAATDLPAESVRIGFQLGRIRTAPGVAPNEVQAAPLALALALRGIASGNRIDLRRGERTQNAGVEVIRERAGFLLACAAAIVASWGFATYARYRSIAVERDRLVATLGTVTKDVFGEKITDPERAKSMALGTGPDADPVPEADALDVIGVLSSSIDTSIKHDLTRLDIADEHVTMEGVVDLVSQRDQIAESLGSYACFPVVNKGNVSRNPADNRQQYSLEIEFRCPGRAARRTTRTTGSGAGGGTSTRTSGSGGGTSTRTSGGGANGP